LPKCSTADETNCDIEPISSGLLREAAFLRLSSFFFCIFRTAQANDGKLHFVTDEMDTIMAGLACGEPCSIGWNVLRDYADHFISCPDYVAAKGMRMLGNPVRGDNRVISGESGAAAFGCVAEIMTNPTLTHIKEMLGLNEHSRVLFFSTEGDTDREHYKAVVWEGKYPTK